MGIIRNQGLKNSIITYIGIAIGFVSLIILQPLFLTSEELGLTRILLAVSYLVSILIPLGIVNVTNKYFPKFRNPEKQNHGYFGIMMLFAFTGIILAGLILYIFKENIFNQYQKESPLFIEYYNWIFPFSVILGIISILNVYCYSLYKTSFASFINDILVRILAAILFGIYFLKFIELDLMITLFIGIYGLQMLILIIFIYKNNALNLSIDFAFLKKNNIKEILGFAFIFTLAAISSYAIKFLDGIIIGKYQHLEIVGIYAVMAFIPTFIEAPLNALEKIANPKISDALSRNDEVDLKDIYYKSCRFMMAIGGLLLILIYTNAGYLLSFMKPEYLKGINVIYIISLSAVFNLYTGTNNAIIYNSKNYLFGSVLLVFIMLLALALNEYLIPIWGMEGAATATALSGFIFNLCKYLFIRYKFKLQPYDLRNVKIILITLISLTVLYFLPEIANLYISAIYKSIFLIVIYVGLIYYSKAIIVSEIVK